MSVGMLRMKEGMVIEGIGGNVPVGREGIVGVLGMVGIDGSGGNVPVGSGIWVVGNGGGNVGFGNEGMVGGGERKEIDEISAGMERMKEGMVIFGGNALIVRKGIVGTLGMVGIDGCGGNVPVGSGVVGNGGGNVDFGNEGMVGRAGTGGRV
ncbi:hypothetical protein NE237_002055 [Protea cynaroides]|uniref:Uncharacterized protein n=1 Tax=Protea cynaroides TaxID=273540 RepID=A0A9Q0QZ11_9MAGN|nr:hypothetical protein NE237_002055 [Protea cynaroides]